MYESALFYHTNGMSYYNYHGMIKKRIRNHELVAYQYVDHYHNIRPCLLLYFNDGTCKPIREYRFMEYAPILLHWEEEKKQMKRRN